MLKQDADDCMTRALLTDGERAALRGDETVDHSTRSSHRSRVKKKLNDRMDEDARILREYAPDLYDRLHESVCEEQMVERVERLEQEVEELRAELENGSTE